MIDFKFIGTSSSGKTKIYLALCNGVELGKISFFGRWRKYCFYPNPETLYDHKCLSEISDFCKKETDIVFGR